MPVQADMVPPMSDVTQILHAIAEGDPSAASQLVG